MTTSTITITYPGLSYAEITVRAESTVAHAEQVIGSQLYIGIRVDDTFSPLLLAKHRSPVHRPALDAAMAQVLAAIDALRAAPMPTSTIRAQILADQAARADGDAHTAATVAACAPRIPETFVTLTAAEQRAVFGPLRAVFGRRRVRHLPRRGGFEVRRVVGFGGDWADAFFSYAEIARLLNTRQTVVGLKD